MTIQPKGPTQGARILWALWMHRAQPAPLKSAAPHPGRRVALGHAPELVGAPKPLRVPGGVLTKVLLGWHLKQRRLF